MFVLILAIEVKPSIFQQPYIRLYLAKKKRNQISVFLEGNAFNTNSFVSKVLNAKEMKH